MSEPDCIEIQHVLVSFKETPVAADRTREEAEALAAQLLERAKGGDDFTAMVREFSDDPVHEEDPSPGVYKMINTGVDGSDFGQVISELNGRAAEKEAELTKKIEEGDMAVDEAQTVMQDFVEELQAEAAKRQGDTPHPRAAMVAAFGDVGFSLAEGEVGIASFDEEKSPFGWHIIKRLA
ncbi:MAG: peptidylprolyl isomerase [Planctomycetota bacterium]|nr:peptidylprolyl isomerase [Planctomycetota bacterium]MDA1113137.1 peptidylprolyl isomerase [Planctomycetota bacterium]